MRFFAHAGYINNLITDTIHEDDSRSETHSAQAGELGRCGEATDVSLSHAAAGLLEAIIAIGSFLKHQVLGKALGVVARTHGGDEKNRGRRPAEARWDDAHDPGATQEAPYPTEKRPGFGALQRKADRQRRDHTNSYSKLLGEYRGYRLS